MKKLITILLLLFISNLLIFSQGSDEIKIAIIPFQGLKDEASADEVAEEFGRSLGRTIGGDNYSVLLRTEAVEAAIRELREQRQDGFTDQETVLDIGKGLNANYVVSGSIYNLSDTEEIMFISLLDVEKRLLLMGGHIKFNADGSGNKKISDFFSKQAQSILDELKKNSWYTKIFQHLTINLPYSTTNRHCAIVLRPVVSEDVMTARFAHLDSTVLNAIIERIKPLNFVDALYYDITNKPPATFGWE